MIKIKNCILIVISLLLIVGVFLVKDVVLDRIVKLLEPEHKVIIEPGNKYVKNENYDFVKQSEDYVPNNYNDLMDIFYSILNQGWLEFTFYCPPSYETCLSDVSKISNDKILLSDINNYVHPYNSYSSIRTIYDESGEVTIYINKLYSTTEIIDLNKEIDEIIKNNTNDTMTPTEKVKALHDYIVNTTTYDKERADNDKSDYDSARATGPIYDHYAICSGYTDLMAIMLNKLGIENFKVASDTHIWNAVKIDDTWLHLDLTWDDPINTDGQDYYDDSYLLINTNRLHELDTKTTDHIYNTERYKTIS